MADVLHLPKHQTERMPPTVYFYKTAHAFSNFHPSRFESGGMAYRWAEQYLMARKAALFGDQARLEHLSVPLLWKSTPAIPLPSALARISLAPLGHKSFATFTTNALALILAAHTPAECKALGRQVTPYDNAVWERERSAIALEMLRLKFGQNQKLLAELAATGDAELVEASPTDRIWGIGFAEAEAEFHRAEWGQNLLGKVLMAVRKEVQTHG